MERSLHRALKTSDYYLDIIYYEVLPTDAKKRYFFSAEENTSDINLISRPAPIRCRLFF
jgi:lipocalin